MEPVIEGARSQNRWKVGFRLFLALPALVLDSAYGGLLFVVALLGWFASLVNARMLLGMRNAGLLALRYAAQTNGYMLLLTDAYPYSGPSPRTLAAPTPRAPSPPLSEPSV